NNDKVIWYENDGAADPSWTAITISSAADYVEGLHHADLDNDGDMDVLSASYSDDKLAWYESDGAADPSFTTRNISTSINGARHVFTADLDNDGDLDILVTSHSDDIVYWYESDGAADPSFTQRTVASSEDEARDVRAADIDNDGDMDVIAAIESEDRIVWYENDGAADPSFTANSVTTSADAATGVFAIDI
ncbi:MAG: VCBS repeat-containing protein, partial [Verrucomicrobiota bacterium]|nr:VCBS repeat-containing protein [Verrucomicrobiota bacterium]